jgi:hypothetical protein
MKTMPFKIRALQLDLARQKEPVPEIKNIISFASNHGFNTLLLYLEDRIKTAFYHYPSDSESYSLKDMEQIVKEAEKRKMEVIPAISTLGHTERFLRFPELAKFAELRGNRKGRFGGNKKGVFCPQLEGTYDFFANYFKEISDVFTGSYFHIGQDETWDFGFCELCGRALRNGTLSQVWANHIIRIGRILEGYGKKLMMWDDMFEFLPETLHMIPHNITMCQWHYDPLVDIPHTHFGWRLYENKMAFYHKNKIPFLICPSDHSSIQNIETFTRSALPYLPQGALLTVWEKGNIFLQSSLPVFAFSGKLWSSPDMIINCEKLAEQTYAEVLKTKDPTLIKSAILFHKIQQRFGYPVSQFVDNPTPYAQERKIAIALARERIKTSCASCKDKISATILRQLLLLMEKELVFHKLHALKGHWEKGYRDGLLHRKFLVAGLNSVCKQFSQLKKNFASEWHRVRNGIYPVNTDKYFDHLIAEVKSIKKIFVAPHGKNVLIRTQFFLPDCYGSQRVSIIVKFKAKQGFEEISLGAPKPNQANYAETPYYYRNAVIKKRQKIESIQLKTWGYGGVGVAFIELFDGVSHYVPAKIKVVKGVVENPNNLLKNDTHWTFLAIQM